VVNGTENEAVSSKTNLILFESSEAASLAAKGEKYSRAEEREALILGTTREAKKEGEEVEGSWKKKRGWEGGNRSQGISRKVRGREYESPRGRGGGVGEIWHFSLTLRLNLEEEE